MKRIFPLVLALLTGIAYPQASPYNIQLFKIQNFTASGQTGAVIALNGLTVGSTVGSSYTSGNITVTGQSLTTATFSVDGSADNAQNWFPLPINALATPGTTATSITVTSAGIYQVNLAGMTHVRLKTSGTFTAVTLGLQLGATPNGLISRSNNGGGGTGTVSSVGDIGDLATAVNPTGPNVTFSVKNAPAHGIYVNNSNSAAPPVFSTAPIFSAALLTGFPTFNQNTTGNAATATALAATPAQCATGTVVKGIQANGTPICIAVPFDTVGSGSNTQTLTVASGGQLLRTGTGIIDASAIGGVIGQLTPSSGFVPIAVDGTHFNWGQLTADNIAPGFTINSFGGAQTLEIGATATNPSFTATYSATPASATLTNTASVDTPKSLTTPFTAVTLTGAFTLATQGNITFTLSATSTTSVTKTSSLNFAFLPRVFGGVGAAGATSSVTASGATAVLSNAAVLASLGLSASQVGATYGPYSPTGGQKIYLLLIGGSHTFKDALTGFAFPFNSPTAVSFTNANGKVISMFLYESTNGFAGGSYSPQVVS